MMRSRVEAWVVGQSLEELVAMKVSAPIWGMLVSISVQGKKEKEEYDWEGEIPSSHSPSSRPSD